MRGGLKTWYLSIVTLRFPPFECDVTAVDGVNICVREHVCGINISSPSSLIHISSLLFAAFYLWLALCLCFSPDYLCFSFSLFLHVYGKSLYSTMHYTHNTHTHKYSIVCFNLKMQLKCECVCEDEVNVDRVYEVMHSVTLSVYVCDVVLVFLYFESSSCHDVKAREIESLDQTHQTGHTSHTHVVLSIYWENNVSVVCICMCDDARVCVLHVSGWPYCCVFLVDVEIMLLQVIFHLS